MKDSLPSHISRADISLGIEKHLDYRRITAEARKVQWGVEIFLYGICISIVVKQYLHKRLVSLRARDMERSHAVICLDIDVGLRLSSIRTVASFSEETAK